MTSDPELTRPELRTFANRTLNMRAVGAVGYDMDYTLIHYRVDQWEAAAFANARDRLGRRGWPVTELSFDPEEFTVGLAFDLELGNLLKATRFGYVVRAMHGTTMLPFGDQREAYQDTIVRLSEPRFEFMNTLFELSRASLFSQLVDIHDLAPLDGIHGYGDLYRAIDDALSETHLTGELKVDIIANPQRFVELDPLMVPTLLDQRAAGKQLLLITNSDWAYSRQMMAYSFDRFCPSGTTWRDLFDIVIVSANKPRFFSQNNPMYRVVDEDESLLRPHPGPLEPGHVYFGGNARQVEQTLGGSSGKPLYVGDHLFGDVHVTKETLGWRTALVARALEAEIRDAVSFEESQQQLETMMAEKVDLDRQQAQLRMARASGEDPGPRLSAVTQAALELDRTIGPLAKASTELGNTTWGPLMRAGNDKSLYARQVERYADIYTSRASNLRFETPYAYLRAARGSLPHDSP